MGELDGTLYAVKIAVSTLFAVSLGVVLSIWWQTTARFDEKIREVERLDREYRATNESFNGKFRDDCLNMHWFSSRAEARVCIEQWRREYNEVRPHSSIAYLTPAAFVRQNRSTPNPGRGEAALY